MQFDVMMTNLLLNRLKLQLKLCTLVITAFMLSGCVGFQLGNKARQINPMEKPVVNITSFSDSLACMDHMLLRLDGPAVTITAQDIRNHTAEQTPLAGMKDMLIASLGRMSERSQKISFVAYGTDIRDILLLHKAHDGREAFKVPDFFIRGGLTQYDRNVLVSRFGSGFSHDDWNFAYSTGQGITYVGLDLHVGLIQDLRILPRVSSGNVLALLDRGYGSEAGGRISSLGTVFDFGIDRRDGLGQAIRNLVDLAAIEVVGKLMDLPYMTCLPLNYQDPEVIASIEKEYYRLRSKPAHLVKVLQFRLKEMGYFHGDINGELDQKTLLALSYTHNLLEMPAKSPLISLELYKRLFYNKPFTWPFAFMKGYSDFEMP